LRHLISNVKLARASCRTGAVAVAAGGTAIVPASSSAGQARAISQSVQLRARVPNIETEVVRPALRHEATDRAIACLVGDLPELDDVLRISIKVPA
jgi:hypothetical protein